MNRRSTTLSWLAAVLLACAGLASIALAQDNPYPNARPIFLAGSHPENAPPAGSPQLTQWNGTFTYQGVKYPFIMVGTDPSKTNTSTTVPVFLVPIKMVYGPSNGNKTFDPVKHKLPDGETVLHNILTSPILSAGIDFKQGGVDLGNTQYIDAFQRGNFWGNNVKKNHNYQVLLGKPTVLPEQTIKVSPSLGSVITNPISGKGLVGTYDFQTLDNMINQVYFKKFKQIHPNALPIFFTYDIYLTSGGCCIGGYHFNNGPAPGAQTYSFFTTVDQGPNEFSQDVSAFSHEIGEWVDNPFYPNNAVLCGELEVGDPLENNPNFGGFPYKLHGFTYNLQDLVFLPYFGAPKSTSLKGWFTFQNFPFTVCQNGG
jgi:hypothetical protein